MRVTLTGPQSEVERVRSVYAAREPGETYSPLRADQVAISASRARVWGGAIIERGLDLGVTLEVGCGTGAVLRWPREVGASSAIGVDVIEQRLEDARSINPGLHLMVASGLDLPVASSSVDTVICSTLFSSILSDVAARQVVSEIERVLAPEGRVLWFDFRWDRRRNTHVRPMSARRVRALFPGWEMALESIVLAPPLAKRLLRVPRVAAVLEALPPLRSHLAGVLHPPR